MSPYGEGIGKPRTRLGKFIDNCGLTQKWLEKTTGLGEATVGRLCNEHDYRPTERTKMTIVTILQNEVDPHVAVGDFW